MTKLCPDTIRACIDALPDLNLFFYKANLEARAYRSACLDRLHALLPDPARELVEEYRQTFDNPDIVATCMEDELAFARWLISSGKMKGE